MWSNQGVLLGKWICVKCAVIVLFGDMVFVLYVLVSCGWLWEYVTALGPTADFVLAFVGAVQPSHREGGVTGIALMVPVGLPSKS